MPTQSQPSFQLLSFLLANSHFPFDQGTLNKSFQFSGLSFLISVKELNFLAFNTHKHTHTHAHVYMVVFEWVTCPLVEVSGGCQMSSCVAFGESPRLVVLARLPGRKPSGFAPLTPCLHHSTLMLCKAKLSRGCWVLNPDLLLFTFSLPPESSPQPLNS